MLDVVTFGESMVLLVPTKRGMLRHAHTFKRFIAGAESNTAIGLAHLGHKTGWISRVGHDEFGHCVLENISNEGVDISRVVTDKQAPTAVFFKERHPDGNTKVFYYRKGSAASRLSPNDLDPQYIAQSKYLHLTGITPALSRTARKTVLSAIEIASKAQVKISLDPNLRRQLWSEKSWRKFLLSILVKIDIILTGAEEAQILSGESDPEKAARELLKYGPEMVIVKLGPEGALAVREEDQVYEPAIKVKVVEPVGAGDAFNAGFLSGLLRKWDLKAALRLGNIVEGLATTVPGDVEGLPTWAQVQQYLIRPAKCGDGNPVDQSQAAEYLHFGVINALVKFKLK